MTKLSFIQIAKKVLEESNQALSPEEIWSIAVEKGFDKLILSQGKTPWRSIGAQLYVDVRDNVNSDFAATDTRPKRFYLQAQAQQAEQPTEVVKTQKPSFLERDLHPFLAFYAHYYLDAHVKTINASKSSKMSFGEWAHPDAVGCVFSFKKWNSEVVDVSAQLGYPSIRLLSFEIKRELNFGNLRESFFQAVSNSTWANEGYLVAANIVEDRDFMPVIRRLSSAFGIGIIRLNIEDPDSTEIICQAKQKDEIDWETVNELAKNRDFNKFLKRVDNDFKVREVRSEEYDEVKSIEDLLKLLK